MAVEKKGDSGMGDSDSEGEIADAVAGLNLLKMGANCCIPDPLLRASGCRGTSTQSERRGCFLRQCLWPFEIPQEKWKGASYSEYSSIFPPGDVSFDDLSPAQEYAAQFVFEVATANTKKVTELKIADEGERSNMFTTKWFETEEEIFTKWSRVQESIPFDLTKGAYEEYKKYSFVYFRRPICGLHHKGRGTTSVEKNEDPWLFNVLRGIFTDAGTCEEVGDILAKLSIPNENQDQLMQDLRSILRAAVDSATTPYKRLESVLKTYVDSGGNQSAKEVIQQALEQLGGLDVNTIADTLPVRSVKINAGDKSEGMTKLENGLAVQALAKKRKTMEEVKKT
jgi:hypothetical protein